MKIRILMFTALMLLAGNNSFASDFKNSTVEIEGYEYPNTGYLKSSGWYCDPFETTVLKNSAEVSVESGKNWAKDKSRYASSEYTLSPWWRMAGPPVKNVETEGGTVSVSYSTALQGQNTLISSEYERLLSELESYIASLEWSNGGPIPQDFGGALFAQIAKYMESYESSSILLSSSHDVIFNEVTVYGTGWATGGTSWYTGGWDIPVICAPPESLDMSVQRSTLKTWIDNEVANYSDLRAHWSFENYKANDVSGNTNHGTWTNYPGYPVTSGKVGAAAWTGGNSYIKIANNGSLDDMNDFTLDAWIYPTARSSHSNILAKVNPGRDFVLQLNSSGQLNAHHASSRYAHCTSSQSIPLNSWSRVTATWNNYYTGGYWNLYINGAFVKKCTGQSQPPWSGNNISIGSLQNGSEIFTGRIDEVKIFNRKLTASEISSL